MDIERIKVLVCLFFPSLSNLSTAMSFCFLSSSESEWGGDIRGVMALEAMVSVLTHELELEWFRCHGNVHVVSELMEIGSPTPHYLPPF